MKNWYTLEADIDLILNKHFTPGRNGYKVEMVILHHNAGNLSLEDCYNVWQTREASAHYQIDINGRVGQIVWDRDTAWHAGDKEANMTSIGIEHANNHANPWTISEACLDAGAHLVAAICVNFELGEPEWLVNVFPHSYFAPTACPGEIAGSQNAEYMARAKKYYREMMSEAGKPVEPSKPVELKKTIKQLAQEVIDGKWGNGEDRKARLKNAGYDPVAVQNMVNEMLEPTPKKSIAEVAKDVINGLYGNGEARYSKLRAEGYNAEKVQDEVNRILGASSTIKVGSKVRVTNPVDYNGTHLAVSGTYDVIQIDGNRVVIGKGSAVTAAIHKNNLKLV